jgi:hypothetical protein
VFAGEVNPGDISIVREILPGDGSFNYDTVVFTDVLANYTIEGGGLVDVDGDGYITVTHDTFVGVGDGTDLVRNVERLYFGDSLAVDIAAGVAGASGDANADPVGLAMITDPTPAVGQVVTASVAGVTDADNVSSGFAITGPVNFTWQIDEEGDGSYVDIINNGVLGNAGNNAPFVGPTFTMTQDLAGMTIRVRAIYQDENGVLETVFSTPPAAPPGPPPGPPPALVTLIDSNFSGGGGDEGGFTYSDGVFGGLTTTIYASGARVEDPNNGNLGSLHVMLGGVDNSDRTNRSGGWEQDFVLAAPSTVTITFDFRLDQASDFEDDEFVRALMSIDGGGLEILATLTGDGNGGPVMTTD